MTTAKFKKCKQCGKVKDIELYRHYYGRGPNKGKRTDGRYKTCKECEAINNRLKYLQNKVKPSEARDAEIADTLKLYELQRAAGLRPPATAETETKTVASSVKDLIAEFTNKPPVEAPAEFKGEIPLELQAWLTKDLTGQDPDSLQDAFDDVYSQYRRQIDLNDKLEPIYDETFKPLLDKIQDRLDDHEEEYYSE